MTNKPAHHNLHVLFIAVLFGAAAATTIIYVYALKDKDNQSIISDSTKRSIALHLSGGNLAAFNLDQSNQAAQPVQTPAGAVVSSVGNLNL